MAALQEWLTTCFFSLIFALMVAKLVSLLHSFRKDNLKLERARTEAPQYSVSEAVDDFPQNVGREDIHAETFGAVDLSASSTTHTESQHSFQTVDEGLKFSSSEVQDVNDENNSAATGTISQGSGKRSEAIEEESFLSDEEDWEGIEGTELEKNFGKAASILEKLVLESSVNVSNELKLQFYGLYKQATEGPCLSPPPPAYRLSARAKWNSWKSLGDLAREEGMQRYVALLTEICPDWNENTKSEERAESTHESSSQKSDKATGMGPVFSTLALVKEDSEEGGLEDLHIFAKEGKLKEIEDLLTAGAAIDKQDADGRTALHWAVDQGHIDIVKLLITFGAQVNFKDSEGQTPLHYAVTCEWDDIAKLLLNNGGDKSLVDNDGCTPYEQMSNTCEHEVDNSCRTKV